MGKGKRGITEREFVGWIARRWAPDARVPVPPGDDAALVRLDSRDLLVAVDTIAEGVDFTIDAPARKVGRKALAINLSDIAAMGGIPVFCVASVVLRPDLDERYVKGLYLGMEALAKEFGCPVVGGDVTGWSQGIVLNVTIAGRLAGKKALTRSGARPGDVVMVTGSLGGSILGRHFTFAPRVEEGAWLARNYPPSAMMDISDGLGIDSGRLAEASGVRLSLDAAAVPVSAAARRLARHDGRGALSHAVSDGEDFELLLTMPEAAAARCIEHWPFPTGLRIIGRVERGAGSWLTGDDEIWRIDSEGYEHLG